MVEIQITEKDTMLIDEDDINLINELGYLRIKKNGYVMATLYTKKIKKISEIIGRELKGKDRPGRKGGKILEIAVHCLLLHEDGKQVDHINRNKLDNRKQNLRLVSFQENQWNKEKQKNNKSGYIGVCFDKNASKEKPWKAYAKHEGITYHLGYYSTAKEAALAVDKFKIEKRGKFAVLNFPGEHT